VDRLASQLCDECLELSQKIAATVVHSKSTERAAQEEKRMRLKNDLRVHLLRCTQREKLLVPPGCCHMVDLGTRAKVRLTAIEAAAQASERLLELEDGTGFARRATQNPPPAEDGMAAEGKRVTSLIPTLRADPRASLRPQNQTLPGGHANLLRAVEKDTYLVIVGDDQDENSIPGQPIWLGRVAALESTRIKLAWWQCEDAQNYPRGKWSEMKGPGAESWVPWLGPDNVQEQILLIIPKLSSYQNHNKTAKIPASSLSALERHPYAPCKDGKILDLASWKDQPTVEMHDALAGETEPSAEIAAKRLRERQMKSAAKSRTNKKRQKTDKGKGEKK